MRRKLIAAVLLAAPFAFSTTVAHAACDAGKSVDDMTLEDAQAVYDCLEADLLAGYKTGPKQWIPADYVNGYRDWTAASTLPANPGVHGGRFLLTFVNEVGAEAYLKYEDGAASIPAGTVIAKESFSVNGDGEVTPGPLFFMEKVAAGTSPETMDWYYSAVAPNGTPMAVPVMQACNECHMGAYGDTGGLGFPVEEARVSN